MSWDGIAFSSGPLAAGNSAGLAMPTVPELMSGRPDRRATIAVCVSLTLVIWLVFWQTRNHDFINFDDDRYVYQNNEVSRGLTVEGLTWFLTHSHARLWHPLTTLSHMIDCQLYDLRPGGHHITNVVFHTLGTMLLFLALNQLTGFFWRSAFVATIFAIHPMRVESVAWVAERKDVLSGIFLALTLVAYVRYARAPDVPRYVAMSILFVCGLMSKATFVTVPLVLLLLDYWPLDRIHSFPDARRVVLEKIPLVVLSLAASAVTVFVQTETMPSLDLLPLLPRIKNAIVSIVAYLRQMFWPSDLAIFYPHPHDQLNIWVVVGCAGLILLITLIVFLLAKRRPYLLVGWLWFLILLFPVLGFFQAGLQSRADRFTYLPHIGITIAVTWTIADLTQRWRYRNAILASAAICLVAVLTICAWKQTTYWRDSVSVWNRALMVTTDSQIAHQNLAAALWSRGDFAGSQVHSRTANIIKAEKALKDFPLNIAARDILGTLLIQAGDVHGAITQWETSLQIDPHDGNALNNLAWIFATYPDDSIRNGTRAVELAQSATVLPGGDSPIVLRTLAAAYAESGDFAKATETAQHAMDLATTQGNSSVAQTLQHERELYQAQKPYRESPSQ